MPINRKLQNLMTGLNTKQVSNGGTSGSIPILYKIAVDGGATESVSLTVDRNLEVVDVWSHLLADGGDILVIMFFTTQEKLNGMTYR